ncbi:MAG: saccharopine dehydrogenase NADP-binding domain-containing protein [Deltaproteobacteria bacterium]|nr:saccharopine dehydrogenase NADP-binding domain-containing protein [Deltaproteobacteria bacterium]
MAAAKDYDLVLFGATGFTGRLVADYLASAPKREGRSIHWAIAGRNEQKLEAISQQLDHVPVLVADALDPAQCKAIAERAHAICTTVGPYGKYGSALVAACADAGTHYCDLTGEVNWMRAMIDAHHARATETGARIVHACGFDSIPSDLGTWAAQQEHIRQRGHAAHSITAVYGPVKGGMSGGTASSAFLLADAMKDAAVRRLLRNPYALDPDPEAPHAPQPDNKQPGWNKALGRFVVPFFMADTNSPVVRRGHALAGHPWGEDFQYREVMGTPGNARGAIMAATITGGLLALSEAMKRPRLRDALKKRAPQPGQGPSEEQRAAGHWRVTFIADGVPFYIVEDPAGDPGYASTSKMLGESALCLAFDDLASPGGVLTPSVAMGEALVERLRRAGLRFHAM